MKTEVVYKILLTEDAEKILQYEMQKNLTPEEEINFDAWTAPWRQESANHYISLGWCMGAFSNEGQLLGYILAQPLLFWQRQTQTVWVEHLAANKNEIAIGLIDVICRWSRDKHLQQVVLSGPSEYFALAKEIGGRVTPEGWVRFTTTKSPRSILLATGVEFKEN